MHGIHAFIVMPPCLVKKKKHLNYNVNTEYNFVDRKICTYVYEYVFIFAFLMQKTSAAFAVDARLLLWYHPEKTTTTTTANTANNAAGGI